MWEDTDETRAAAEEREWERMHPTAWAAFRATHCPTCYGPLHPARTHHGWDGWYAAHRNEQLVRRHASRDSTNAYRREQYVLHAEEERERWRRNHPSQSPWVTRAQQHTLPPSAFGARAYVRKPPP